MTVNIQTRQTVRAYHDARFLGDVPAAVAHLADQFTFQSPLMSSDEAVGHLAGLPGFLEVVTGVDMLSELYGETEATLVYDVHTATPVGTQRTAEHFQLRDGRITSITLIFDATLWRLMTTTGGAPFTGAAATQEP
ncbi:nuclear transport factor 2 family protein [Dactylosporangium sp. NPDC000555]|uniref:nuclear transport factor 2 family protein n=1 Tax=Dactylosporangium sp. NPDC000555 TaxID=3154260 RepID=UPI003316B5B6